MKETQAPLFPAMAALADPLRSRILLLVERRELSVAELVEILQLPQSNISRHLKVLGDAGLVSSREDGASNRYRMISDLHDASLRRLWSVLREQAIALPAADEDARRLATVRRERRVRSQAYFSSAAGQWDKIRSELFGEQAPLQSLLALLDPDWIVGDLGCGTGHLAQQLAPFVREVIAIDDSAAMLSAARKRLGHLSNVSLRRGDIAALPLDDDALDVGILQLVLPFVEEPVLAFRESARVLRTGGRLLVIDMLPHDREDMATEMGHIWRGFNEGQLAQWGREAGLSLLHSRGIPPDPAARGPSLFAAVFAVKTPVELVASNSGNGARKKARPRVSA